ncbi:S9 family peptidase [Parapedobacter soli]|uniref:S9 family peptidase n=1 Tax=Parapedobacter soli TaxID=416955 RepID=UPI0021CA30DE|nr:prolyl oligopeptidase family serine peptidase [Parapedobacter soli]
MTATRRVFIFLLLVSTSAIAWAQKKPLDHSVYDGWETIDSAAISDDGRFIYYLVSPQAGDGRLVVTDPDNRQHGRIDRGTHARFSADGKYLIARIKPRYAETREAKIKKKKADEMPKDSLAIFTLETAALHKIPFVTSYKIPEEPSEYIAYLTEEPAAPKDTATADTTAPKKLNHKKNQPTLHIRHLTSGADTTIDRVGSYEFSTSGNAIVYVRKAEEKDSLGTDAGVYYYDLATRQSRHISRGKGTYKNLAFDDASSQLAFTADKSPEKSLQKAFDLYYYTPGQDSAIIIASRTTNGVPDGWYISGDGAIRFSKNGEKLFFGIAPIPRVKDTTLVEFEHAKVDIWHWKDDYLQSQQLANLKREQNRSYLAVTYPKQGRKVVPLADEQLPDTRLTEDADNTYVLATTDIGRRIETQWQAGSFQDVYLVSTIDGSRRKIASDIRGRISISPQGKYVVWFNRTDGNWYSFATDGNQAIQLNTDLPVSFANEDNDVPDEPGDYGFAGWSDDDGEIFIYDKYDIWAFHPDGSKRRLVTNGAGRSSQVTFRYRDAVESRRSRYGRRSNAGIIDTKKRILLSAFNHITKEHGWFHTSADKNRDPREMVMGPYSYRTIKRAADANTYIYTKENYVSAPDLYVSANFTNETKLSSINPQQQQYNWGTAELVKWTTPHGHDAEGILYKPEDFNPGKKYPVIAYFYEELSDGLYSYIPPTPTPSRLNISFFVSNGYVVFAPDIHYEIGHPGRSAEEYVNSGMEELKKHPWIDSTRMGIQGQSWGGYQVAHLITRTDMYAAAWAGAPVVNMTSAYGGIRWQSGMNRQFQYERTQSRIGATLWEKPELYIENSPLFHLPNVTTPVVIMHNDQDGAVPWYQGIEMFTALRRLQKPVWLLNYNGDAHNLVQRQNRKDIQRRQLEFFDHFLKGKPAAPWIEHGVPATLKGIDWGFGD